MPVKRGLPTWLEQGGVLIAPAMKPRSLQAVHTVKQEPAREPQVKLFTELKLPREGETLSPDVAIQLLVLGEYEILQAYLDRRMSERFPRQDEAIPSSPVPVD